ESLPQKREGTRQLRLSRIRLVVKKHVAAYLLHAELALDDLVLQGNKLILALNSRRRRNARFRQQISHLRKRHGIGFANKGLQNLVNALPLLELARPSQQVV